jgi:hypothetical protein
MDGNPDAVIYVKVYPKPGMAEQFENYVKKIVTATGGTAPGVY